MAGPATLAAVPLMPRLTVGFAGSLLAMARQAPAGRAPEALGAKVTLRVALPPAITVNGTAGAQVTEPGVPGQDETPVRLSGAVPAFCTWVLSIFELPTVTVWKLSEVGLRAIAGVAVFVAVPLRPRLKVGFAGSLLAMARQAPGGRAPAAVGAKVTRVTFSGAVPAFCTWVVSVFEVPTVTVWKLSEAGFRTMAGAGVFVAVPLRPRLTVGFTASLLATARQAPAGRAPAAVGAKVTLRLALAPGATVTDAVGAQVIEPGVPGQAETLVTFSGAVPVFCTWVLSVFEPPTVSVWKSSAVGLRAIAGAEATDTMKAGSATVW